LRGGFPDPMVPETKIDISGASATPVLRRNVSRMLLGDQGGLTLLPWYQFRGDLPGLAGMDGDCLILCRAVDVDPPEAYTGRIYLKRHKNAPFAVQRNALIVRVVGCNSDALRECPVVPRRT